MPDNQNRLSKFWQELKRRKVVRVITVYAAAAFVILELLSIIIEPLRLPDWTLQFAIVFLCIGFVIAIILSWVYDIHPEGGIVRSEPAHKVKSEDVPASTNSWKIASYISFVVIVGLIVLNILPRTYRSEVRETLEKSIAVLPFRNDSPDQERMYFINGTMEAILDNLCKIEDLRVVSRNSVEQYRDNPKPTLEVAEEMKVIYVLEGSGHRDGNNIRLFIQLLDGKKDQHLWSKSYDADIEEIFSMQSEIAQLVAGEIEAVITPAEKELIEKIPTHSLTAYDFYQRARAEHESVGFDWRIKGDLERAEYLYYKALEYDSTFALAYTGLAWAYWSEHALDILVDENYLDTLLILADKALSFDHQLSEAYVVKGLYYFMNKISDQAYNEIDKAIRFNPNDWLAYYTKGRFHEAKDDHKNSIDNYFHATSLYRGPLLQSIYGSLAYLLSDTGFKEIGEKYAKEALALEDDLAGYYSRLAIYETINGNFNRSIELYENATAIDSTLLSSYSIGDNYLYLGQFEEALVNYKKAYEISQTQDRPENDSASLMFRIGQSYMNIGMEEAAANYLNRAWDLFNKLVELERFSFSTEIADLYKGSLLYAELGDTDNAFKYLRLLNQKQHIPVRIVVFLKADPAFNDIRDEPEFKQIFSDIEAKYQAEHERVRKWLEENDLL
jgi:TolB-like protein/Flp pilus assembly protein TadD